MTDEEHTEAYPNEQPHHSTNDHDGNWDDEICSVGPIGLLIESILWNGMQIDDELRFWQNRRATHQHLGDPLPESQNVDSKSHREEPGIEPNGTGESATKGREPLSRLITTSAVLLPALTKERHPQRCADGWIASVGPDSWLQ